MTIVDMSTIVAAWAVFRLQAPDLRLKDVAGVPICQRMSVGSIAPAGATSPEAREIERQAAVMRKARDVQESQAEGLIALVKSARPDGVGQLLSVYA